ncbi:MAG: nitric oxide reductase activation protein [Gammaproteobacteria bacterium]|nr:nitric oxide reductase activation protein [Gammaproteobacteria bacterium]
MPRPAQAPLTPDILHERIAVILMSDVEADETIDVVVGLSRAQQEFVLHWAEATARTSSGLAYQFIAHANRALQCMNEEGVESWLVHCMDVYDTSGLHAAVCVIQSLDEFSAQRERRKNALGLESVRQVLETFVCGLGGRALKITVGETVYTDTETIFLPEYISHGDNRAEHFDHYKVLAVHQWAQCMYGTWRIDLEQVLLVYANPDRALALFYMLETVRLDACIARDLPGIYRQMQLIKAGLQPELQVPPRVLEKLEHVDACVESVVELLHSLYVSVTPVVLPYQGELFPDKVKAVRDARLAQDYSGFRKTLAQMADEYQQAQDEEDVLANVLPTIELRTVESESGEMNQVFELEGQLMAPPDDVKGTLASIMQDLGMIPDEYLHAAGDGGYYAGVIEEEALNPEDVWKGTYHEEGAFLYNEWDFNRKYYRKNWAVLRELEVHPVHDGFVADTLKKYHGLIAELRRSFEALRGEDRLLRKQPFGDDVDIDALVEAYADVRSGLEMSDRLFTRKRRLDRNIAALIMVDMSGSTKGWINDAEREALVLLCESLESLGDRYAIYGFSGMTRKRCEVYRIKSFDDAYDNEVRARISGISPRDYTRMGVAIRHFSYLLNEQEARTRLLITLSDGKPDDYDGYRGAYGIEDTRQALIEARQEGIHPFCITIDTEGADYLPHMYGAVNYAVLDDVRKLPLKVSEIYRRLTTA